MASDSQVRGYYYWVATELQNMIPVEEKAQNSELDEIDQIRKLVELVDETINEPPQFFTTT
jgi:hypothetical protein